MTHTFSLQLSDITDCKRDVYKVGNGHFAINWYQEQTLLSNNMFSLECETFIMDNGDIVQSSK